MTVAATQEPTEAKDEAMQLSRRRRIAIWTLIVLASVIGLISLLTVWVDRQLLNNESWQKASTKVIQDPEVRSALSIYLVNQLYDNVDVAAQLEQKLPPSTKPLAGPISAALRQPAGQGVEFLLARPRVQQLWINAMDVAHQKLINVLENKTGFGIATGNGVVTLDLHQLVDELGIELGLPQAALDKLPPDAGVITVMESDQLSAAQTAVRAVKVASAWLAVLVLAMFALAVYLARGARRETLRNIGWAFVFVGLLVLVIRRLGGNYIVESLVDNTYQPSGHRLWLIGTEVLAESGRAAIFYGVTVIVGAILAGPTRIAVATRTELAPIFRHRPAVAWAVVAGAYLLLLMWGPTHALRRPLWILIFGVLLAAGVEVLRRQTLREFPDDPVHRPLGEVLHGRLRRPAAPAGDASQKSAVDELAKLNELHEAGAIDDDEFERGKHLVLS